MLPIALSFLPVALLGQEIRVLVSNVPGAEANHPTVGQGYLVRPAPHVDLNVIWDATSQTFRGGFRTDDEWINGVKQPPTQYEADQAIVFLPQSGRSQVLEGDPTFFGSLGDDVWILPSSGGESAATLTPYVGFSAYGVPNNGTFTGSGTSGNGRVFWSVHSVENLSNPVSHQFYGYNDSLALRLAPPGYQPSAELTMLANGHSHLNLLFKAAGMYRITFRVRGTLVATGQEVSSLIPVYFGVERWEIPGAVQPPTGYDGWKLANFSSAQAADPAVSGLGADPDGDGADNLVEYAFGGNPTNAAGGLGPTVSTTNTSGTNWLRFAYRARTNDPALVIQPGFKVSLTETNWSTNVLVQKVSGQPAGDGVYEDQVWQTPLGADARRFLRLQISR